MLRKPFSAFIFLLFTQSVFSQNQLINNVAVYTPFDNVMCQTKIPWKLGRIAAHASSTLSCFGITVDKAPHSELAIFVTSQQGITYQLLPNGCDFLGNVNGINKLSKIFIPADDNGIATAFRLEFIPHTFYVIAIDEWNNNNNLSEQLRQSAVNICDINARTSFPDFNAALNQLLDSAQDHIQVQRYRLGPDQ